MTVTTGIHTMPAHEYHADPTEAPSLTASMIQTLASESPLHAWTNHPRLNPEFKREDKTQFDIGTVAHALLLEGDSMKVQIVEADSWRSNAAKEAAAEARAAGRTPLLAEQWQRVNEMVDAVREQIEARDDEPPLFSDGKPEQTLVWQEHGITCRARLDWLRDDLAAIDDLKSTAATANPLAWARRTLWSIGADVQVAFYLRGLKRVAGADAAFRYALAESKPPYAISVISLAPSAVEIGTMKVERAIETWRTCLRTDTWPAFPQGIYYAEAPAWAELQAMEQDAEIASAA